MTKISVIIPCYNIAAYLEKALESVVNQTFKDIEVICVDDCSTDNTLDILKRYAKNDNRFVIIEQKENKGQGVARNIALDIAKGDYIMYLDPDDWYELDAFEMAYNQITKYNNDIVFYNFYIYKENTKKRKVGAEYEKCLNLADQGTNLNARETFIPCCGCCWAKIYNKDFLIKNDCRFTETRYCEDQPFAVKTTILANSISVLNKPLYNYRKFTSINKYRKNVTKSRANSPLQLYANKELCLEYLDKYNAGGFKNHCLTSLTNGLLNETIYCAKNNRDFSQTVYSTTREMLQKINKKHNIELLGEEIDKKDIKLFLKYKYWWQYNLISNIFSVKIRKRAFKQHLSITVFGIKMHIKMRYT